MIVFDSAASSDLLEILGQARNPMNVQLHLQDLGALNACAGVVICVRQQAKVDAGQGAPYPFAFFVQVF